MRLCLAVSPPVSVVAIAFASLGAAVATLALVSLLLRAHARGQRSYVRLRVLPYRGDEATAESVVAMFDALHKRLLRRWWRRLCEGQPSAALEAHFDGEAWLAICCQAQSREMIHAALRAAYPNCKLVASARSPAPPPTVLRIKKRDLFIKRAKMLDPRAHAREPAINRLITALAASGGAGFVQVAITPAPQSFQRRAKHLYKRREAKLSRQRGDGLLEPRKDRSLVEESELEGGLSVQHKPLFFTDIRVIGTHRRHCERIASELRADVAENPLVERGTAIRHGIFGLYAKRVIRGEGNPQPSTKKGVFASTELAAIWHMPSIDYVTVPFDRSPVPFAPASPAIMRTSREEGALLDERGGVSIQPHLRKQNTAVTGTVEQGKSSYLVATVREDLRRERTAIIVLDPKGDAADAAISAVPEQRTCTLLDFSHPCAGFNPLAVNAPADVIADYVVAALKNLFTESDIRASSDRYLRNAIIAVLAYDRSATLWDAARLLSVGADGYAYRARVGARVRELPELKEISEFFTAELSAQLADARSATTAKLDAPVNKLARLLNSPSIKRILLNDSLIVDFDEVISQRQVLVVKGALGAMGAGNTAVLMQLLIGMLDAALARQQDRKRAQERVVVALKVDEAPLVLTRGFAETMALKRSAGLETLACWQADAQWVEREVRDQLDALFAHRVCFATASVEDARKSARLMMAEFSDTVRPRIERLSALGHPDARLRLPKHCAIASWTTEAGRQPPFVAWTLPLQVDPARLAFHAKRQAKRGGSYKLDLSQPHWGRDDARGPDHAPRAGRADPHANAGGDGNPDADPVRHAEPRGDRDPPAHVDPAGVATGSMHIPARKASPRAAIPPLGMLPSTPAQSFRELVDLDAAHSVREAVRAGGVQTVASRRASDEEVSGRPGGPGLPSRVAQLEFDGLDLRDIAILVTVASFRHVFSSQIHRRVHPGKSVTTTQRRLKRLADLGLIERLQFHKRDGAGVPMCCAATPAALRLLAERKIIDPEPQDGKQQGPALPDASQASRESLALVRRDLHAAGWALAFEAALDGRMLQIVGPRHAPLSPPSRTARSRPVIIGPPGLELPQGRAPHHFVHTSERGRREEVERFETIRPHLRLERPERDLPPGGRPCHPPARTSTKRIERLERDVFVAADRSSAVATSQRIERLERDVFVELDDRVDAHSWVLKLERYDHFLTGWCFLAPRYRRHPSLCPLVVFVCRDRRRARECASRADTLLIASKAYAGEHPADWEYAGRECVAFVSERDVHEGVLYGYGVAPLPPEVRRAVARDESALAAAPIVRHLLRPFDLAQDDA